MAYIIKNTSGLVNTRLTDVGRRKLSQGNFNITYFQVGDSEVNYNAVPNYNQTNNNILMPAFNAQNNTGTPQSNKQNVKYPYYLVGGTGNTYGIPYPDPKVDEVYNSAGEKGFFVTGGTKGSWTAETSSAYTITSNYWVDMSTLTGQTVIDIELDPSTCSPSSGTPSIGDFVTIITDINGGCGNFGTYPIFTYKIQDLSPLTGTSATTTWTLTLDRTVPNYSGMLSGGEYARVLIYPSGMTVLYDFVTPEPYWQTDTLNFESPCDVSNRENTLIWNMNIPWSESPAGLRSSIYEDYTKFGSVSYIGSKEYLGYQENSGQTFYVNSTLSAETTNTFYYNSFDEKINVQPKDQKAIAIIHYTNQDIDNVYGEKFSTQPYDPQNPTENIGLARNLKVTLPTLMWHKSSGNTIGETFFIDPPGYNLCNVCYMYSKPNPDMNEPGLRYFHLWDTNVDSNGNLNRIGKVFPDQEIIVIDDEEVVAAMSYKSNRNWTLPAPQLSLLTPNICFSNNTSGNGLLNNSNENLWVTYLLESSGFTNYLHCNYYSVVSGPTGNTGSQDVAVRFGPEFPFLSEGALTGFSANRIKLLVQKISGDTRPSPTGWYELDVTDQISATLVNNYITMSGLTGTTFQVTLDDYQTLTAGTTYNLADYIDLPENGETDVLNFGDEYYFYGNFSTDISATIYEMKYLINLNNNQFTNTSNPTWTSGTTSYITEIGLYDEEKDLIVVSKLQSPQKRQGIQQFVVKLDF
jgi:hypothetical protein